MNDSSTGNQTTPEEITVLKNRISELERTNETLKRERETFRTTLESIPAGVALIGPGGEYRYVNPEFTLITGYSLGDVPSGRDWFRKAFPEPSYRKTVKDSWKQDRLSEAGRSMDREFTIVTKDGNKRDVGFRSTFGNGFAVAVLRDVTGHKRAEEALRRSEAKFKEIFETIEDLYYETDSEGIVRVLSPSVHCLTGWNEEDMIGKPATTVYADPSRREQLLSKLSEKGYVHDYELVLRKKDGEERKASLSARIILDDSGQPAGVRGLLRDITDRKQTEEALRLSEATLKSIFSAAPVGIVITDVNRVPRWTNEAMCSITGYTVEEQKVTGARLFYASEEEYVRVGRTILDEIQKGGVGATDTQWNHKNGETRYVHLRGAAIDPRNMEAGLVFTAVDVTSRKRAEQSLLESEAKYRMVVENSLVGFGIIQDNAMRFVNERWCAIFGYPPEEVTDRLDPVVTVHPEDREMVRRLIGSRVDGTTDRVEYEFRGVRKDGSPIMLKVLGGKMLYGGRPAATSTIVDITRERNLEAQLLQSQKMEAIGALAGGIAHDFNNILTAIIGYASLLRMNMDANDPRKVYVESVLSASQKAAQLTHGLLAFSRKQAIELKPGKVNEIVRGVEKLLKRLITEDIEFKVTLSDRETIIMADISQMDQVLMNLATNSRDAMPRGGTLFIETNRVHIDDEFIQYYGYGETGDYALISVADTGVGMDRETREKIFEPFFTTKQVGKGTGLGLSIVYGIIKQHGGYINVFSEPGKGTSFDIYIPAVKTRVHEAEKTPGEARGGTETILVAEDNDELRSLVREVMKGKGYSVIEAADGEEALRKFSEHREAIDLMLLDVVMPRKNGKEVYEESRSIDPKMKFLFTSGYTRDIILDKGIEDDAVDFIKKPLSPDDLLLKVREVLDRATGQ